MFTRSKMLLLSTLIICILAIIIGCDQPEDVVTPEGNAYLTLKPQSLPTNPDGTMYELWVANHTDTVSLGKFGYNFDDQQFLTKLGANRPDGGLFLLEESIDNYISIIVSVEPTINDVEASPASIMLIDFVSSPTVKLLVPEKDSIWASTIRYNLKTPSDGVALDMSNDGSAIWFCGYRFDTTEVVDTLSIISWEVVPIDTFIGSDTIVYDTHIVSIDSVWVIDTIMALGADTLGVGIDTISRTAVRFTATVAIDSMDYVPTTLNIIYSLGTPYDVYEEFFNQDRFEMPNLQKYGWKYKGWVVSNAIDTSAIGSFTEPAWIFTDPVLTTFEGGLLTTGTFYDINSVDLENPHIDTVFKKPPRIPRYPGEDFLENLPAPLTSVPNLAGSGGHVFITLEPEFYEAPTNFPLLVFVGFLPSSSAASSAHLQDFTLNGYMYDNDPFRGFPKILVDVERF